MRYFKIVSTNYIIAIGTGNGGIEITESEYNTIMAVIQTPRPEPPQGKAWALRADTLEYELVDVPDPEPEEEEATEADYQAALNAMGVSTDEA